MAPTNFDLAKADRLALSDHLKFLELELNNHGTAPLDAHQADMYISELEETRKLIGPNHSRLRSTAPSGTDMDPIVAEYNSMNRLSCRIYSGLHGIKMSLPSSVPTTTASASTQELRIPKIELIKFSGNLQEWISFRDVYVTTIHTSKLTNVQKLAQLKSLLTGEAARQIRSLVLSDTNYDIAWKLLTERYENNRELLFSILKRLLNQPVVSSSTATNIRSLIDTTRECTRSLEVLSIPTQHWDAMILFLLFSKLDPSSKELWEQSLPDSSIPTLSKMFEFLEQRARALAASNAISTTRGGTGNTGKSTSQSSGAVRSHHIGPSMCKFGCNQPHFYYKCPLFRGYSPQQRLDEVKRHNLCLNCITPGHLATSCSSKHSCKVCNKKHHTMLHFQLQHTQLSTESPTTQPHVTIGHVNAQNIPSGIMATATVRVINSFGNHLKRSLIDGGSTHSTITQRAARQMRLPLTPVNIPMTGLQGSSLGSTKHVTHFTFKPHFESSVTLIVSAFVVKSISSNIPSRHLDRTSWPYLNGLQLADPSFHIPNEVDILFGSEIAWSILESEKISGSPGQPDAIKTSLGWLVGGANNTNSTSPSIFSVNFDQNLDHTLRRFWEQEEVTLKSDITTDEKKCEEYFASTYKRQRGKFIVSLPFKTRPTDDILGSSREAAVKRFLSTESKFIHQRSVKNAEQARQLTKQWSEYTTFMQEYEQLGHMIPVATSELNNKPAYYIPHHSVLKESSTTTKLRVVFDASAITSTKVSLNQLMLIGPQLQDNIADIMLRFRLHPIAFTADICKMYRQILVSPDDTDFQRIIWRDNPSQPLKDYKLLTVTYGTSSAPYLAVKCLQQLARDEQSRFPKAAKVALSDFYVDDATSGCDTLEDAKQTVQQLMDLCMSGGFELRKWTTNNQDLLATIPPELRETSSLVELQEDSTIKTLGVYWNPASDKYSFSLTLPPDMPGTYTKRLILSEIAKIYDPLGWLSPAIIVCKNFMQDLWKTKLNWDDKLPTSIEQRWAEIKSSLRNLENLEIPRCVAATGPVHHHIIGCSDASTKAISAVIYLRCDYADHPSTCHMLTSKTKVAPVKHVTLPRLELNGAVLLSELIKSTVRALKLSITSISAYTDSTITYHWVTSSPLRWKQYVRNRVQQIQDNIPDARWYHIAGEFNPADCASRGVTAEELIHHPYWWNGVPEFVTPTSSSVDLLEEDIAQMNAESQVIKLFRTNFHQLPDFFVKYSSFRKLVRVISFMQRFVFNCRSPKSNRNHGPLTVAEMEHSRKTVLLLLQQVTFPEEYSTLTSKGELHKNSHIIKLQPFLCEDGLIRVGGRLRNCNWAFHRKHPILLPRNHHLTSSIIRDVHLDLHHAGASSVLASIQHQYWILNGRDTVRFQLRKCIKCCKIRADLMNQIMGDLPTHRVNPSRPFNKVGVDYAGPFSFRPMVRSRATLKCWLAIFVCFTTHALHIEVVSTLSTEGFLAALRRFINRRGKPSDIFSDCGTNFKGTNNVLQDFLKVTTDDHVRDHSASHGIQWHFNPAGAPHFGGLWEAGVKSIKYHLKRTMGTSMLTLEELNTLVIQIEGILNSRPIVAASSDPSDLGALTPAHFLIGSSLTSFPEPSLTDVKQNHLKRWELLQQQQQLFWKRWSSEFISRQQQRPKWFKQTANLQVGQLVMVKDERLPPLKWKVGRVTTVHPGADGKVRVATLKTSEGEIKRPIVKLCVLPVSSND